MRRIFQNSIALLVVVIVLFLIVPLHPALLDILIIINISLSIVILMITMTISEALEFSIFPSLLLITTLFRLGLNVSTTRQILGNAGGDSTVTFIYTAKHDGPFFAAGHQLGFDEIVLSQEKVSLPAPADGKVVFAQSDGAYGLSVEVDHGNGIITRYAHMSKINVKRGDSIKRGSLIGLVGNTGRSTGAHLHYEVIVNGVHTDPMAYIIEK